MGTVSLFGGNPLNVQLAPLRAPQLFSRLQRTNAILDVPYYMTVTVSGRSVIFYPDQTDYGISLRVMKA